MSRLRFLLAVSLLAAATCGWTAVAQEMRGPGMRPMGDPNSRRWMEVQRSLAERFREGPPLSPEQREKILAFVDENMPLLSMRLREASEKSAEAVDMLLRRRLFEIHRLMELQATDPKAFASALREERLSFTSYGLVRQYRTAKTDEERERIKTDLRKAVEELFQIRYENELYRIEKLEEKLRELRDVLAERDANRQEIIDRYLTRITGEDRYLEWDRPFDVMSEVLQEGRR